MILNRQKIQRMSTGSTTVITGGGGSGSSGGSGGSGGGSSDYATNAGHADTADSATNATHATNADYATSAGSASTATSANEADALAQASTDWLIIARKDITQTIDKLWTFVKGVVTKSLKVMDFYQPLTLIWSYKKCWEFVPGGGNQILIYYHTACTDQWFLNYKTAYHNATGETISVGDIIVYNAAYDPDDKFFTEGRFGVVSTGTTIDNFLAYAGETSIIEAVNSLQGTDIVALFDEVAIPSAASCGGKHIVIKNRGTASTGHTAELDVYAVKNNNVASQFFDYIVDYPNGTTGHLSNHITVHPGETVEIFSDGNYWVKI